MAEIVTLNQESPLEFLWRHGPAMTHQIASRYSLTTPEALVTMKGLEKIGHVAKRRRPHCMGWEWYAISQRGWKMNGDKLMDVIKDKEAAKIAAVIQALKAECRRTLGHEMGEPLLRKFAEAAVATCAEWH